jgi:predicted RND superfamily exporter protein
VSGPARNTAESATPQELKAASLRLALWLGALVVIGPAIRALPLGQTTRTVILAWILMAAALYWLYGGLGFRPLLLLQIVIFSTAVTLLSIKVLLVGLDVKQFDFLREAGRTLLIVGGACAGANLGMMLVASLRRR